MTNIEITFLLNAETGVSKAFTPNKDDDFITTNQILDSARNSLKRACRKDQTYDDKINQLLDLELNR